MKRQSLSRFLRRYRFSFLAFFCYVASCAFLYYIQFVMFDQAIKTPFVYGLIMLPVLLISWLLYGKEKRTPRTETRLQKSVGAVISSGTLIVCSLLIGFFTYKDPYFLNGYIYFALLLFCWFVSVRFKWPFFRPFPSASRRTASTGSGMYAAARKPPDGALLVAAIYAVMMAASLLYLLLLHPCSVQKATRLLTRQGYTATAYCGHYPAEAFGYVYQDIPEELAADRALGYYLFRAEKDDATHGIFVRLTDGQAVRTETAPENQVLRNLLNLTK